MSEETNFGARFKAANATHAWRLMLNLDGIECGVCRVQILGSRIRKDPDARMLTCEDMKRRIEDLLREVRS